MNHGYPMNLLFYNSHYILAAIATLLGVVVLFGWQTHNSLLIQVQANFVPMQFNTAVCFALSGLALILSFKGHLAIVKLLALIIGGFAVTTLVQYLANLDFGIDQLFIEHYIQNKTSHPGRMAPNTGLCFTLAAIAIYFLPSPKCTLIATFLGAIVSGLGFISLFGYFSGLTPIFGWGKMTQMAAHTSFGFFLIGMSLLRWSYLERARVNALHHWLNITITISVMTILITLSFALQADRDIRIQRQLEKESQLALRSIHSEINSLAKAHARLAARSKQTASIHADLWRHDAQTYLLDFPQYHALLQMDQNHNVQRRINTDPDLLSFIKHSIAPHLQNKTELETHFLGSFVLKGQTYSPIVSVFTGDDSRIHWLIGILNQNTLFSDLRQQLNSTGLLLNEITVNGSKLIQLPNQVNTSTSVTANGLIASQHWSISISIPAQGNVLHYSPIHKIYFFSAILICGLLAWLSWQSIKLHNQKNRTGKLLERLSNTINALPDGLILTNCKGNILQFNQALQSMYRSTHGLEHKNIQDIIPDIFKNYSNQSDHNTNIQERRVLRVYRDDGSSFPVKAQVTQYEESGDTYRISVIQDLTQKIADEAKLAETEAILHAAFDSSHVGMIIIGAYQIIEQTNGATANLLGYEPFQLVGMKFSELFCENHKYDHEYDIDRIMHDHESNLDCQTQLRHNNGSVLWGHLSISSVKDKQGRVRYLLAQIIDISPQKQLESHLNEKNKILKITNTELEQFAYAASHDLKEPVRTLKTFSSYLIRNLENGNHQRAEEDKQFINKACDRMTSLIDALLALSRSSQVELKSKKCSLTALLTEVLEQLNDQITRNNADITLPDSDFEFEADPTQFNVALQNLLQNAIKFRKPNLTPVINIQAKLEEHILIIKVSDNGIGIASNYSNQIFGVFKRLHTDKEYEGTGIGLALVSKIISRHNGEIKVTSDGHTGTTFTIFIPIRFKSSESDT